MLINETVRSYFSIYINKLKNFGLLFFVFFLYTIVTQSASAGGISLGATRIIYPLDSKQTTISITNSDDKNRFLIQSWIDNDKGQKSTYFIVTPPLFVSNPNSENILRIIRNGGDFPQDRESLLWLNSKSIPSLDRNAIADKNVLQIAILSKIKIFIRPDNLPSSVSESPASLRFSKTPNGVIINNPSPYYVTLINFKIGNKPQQNVMISPKSSTLINDSTIKSRTVSYQTIDDYGGSTPVINTTIN